MLVGVTKYITSIDLLNMLIVLFTDCHYLEDTVELCIIMEYMSGLPLNDIVEPR